MSAGNIEQAVANRSRAEVPFAFDPDKWDSRTEDGKRTWSVRCRVPFTYDCPGQFALASDVPLETREVDEVGDGRQDSKPFIVIEGIASSTSVDFYGTEMSGQALQRMAEQFRHGVVYVPTHGEREWHEVMGESFEAGVIPADVENPANSAEAGFVLKVRVRLYKDDERVAELQKRLGRSQKIGQSIGGWFTEIRLIANDEGEIERVIVEEVELDHLAVTRAPANPDSWISMLRSKVDAALDALATAGLASLSAPWRAPTAAPALDALATPDPTQTSATAGTQPAEQRAAVDAPSYRPTDSRVRKCGSCMHYDPSEKDRGEIGRCSMFSFRAKDGQAGHTELARVDYVCNAWEPVNDDVRKLNEIVNDSVEPQAARHVVDVIDEGSTVLVRFEKAEAGEHPDEDETLGVGDAEVWSADDVGAKRIAEEYGIDPQAARAIAAMSARGVVPFQDLPLDDESEWAWDTDAEAAVLGDGGDNWQRYKRAHTWSDPEGADDAKGSYKLPIAKMKDGRLTAYMAAVSAAMAALNGARGGVNIPDADRQAVYNHLVRYYDKAGREPPVLKSATDEQSSDGNPAVGNVAEDRATGANADSTGDDMTPEQVAALTGTLTALGKSVETLNERVAALSTPAAAEGSRVEPVSAAPETDEVKSLRAKLEAAEREKTQLAATLDKIASQPQRRGVRSVHMPEGSGKQSFLSGLVARAKETGSNAIAAVFTPELQRNVAENYASAKDHGAARSAIIADLHTVLDAARADGLILEPDERASAQWR